MKIAVKDANLLIDIELMGLFDVWLQLPYQNITSSLVSLELAEGDHQAALSYINEGLIEEHILDTYTLYLLAQEYEDSGLSETDLSVMYLAETHDAILLSGDGALRGAAEAIKIEVHGTIWILEKLVEYKLLSKQIAADKLGYLLSLAGDQKRFLPKKICQEQIKMWRRK